MSSAVPVVAPVVEMEPATEEPEGGGAAVVVDAVAVVGTEASAAAAVVAAGAGAGPVLIKVSNPFLTQMVASAEAGSCLPEASFLTVLWEKRGDSTFSQQAGPVVVDLL